MLLSRTKAATSQAGAGKGGPNEKSTSNSLPTLEQLLLDRDYTGALTLLEFERSAGTAIQPYNWLWTGYAAFHLGDYMRAMTIYQKLVDDAKTNNTAPDPLYHLYLAVTQFYLGMYEEADANAKKGPQCKLQNRLHFHASHKLNDEKRLMFHHQHLQDVVEDQLTLASIHYLRGHYQEAIDIYKRLLGEHPEYLALNVYLALCYYKLDYYDVAQEVLALYLARVPDSVTAGNLKACNHFRLYNGKAAELELKQLLDRMSASGAAIGASAAGAGGAQSSSGGSPTFGSGASSTTAGAPAKSLSGGSGSNQQFAADILRHNLVVFRNGEGALGVLEPLVDVVPEARLNLALWHLRHDDMVAAYELMKDVDPASPAEYILKAIVFAVLGQAQESRDHLKQAQQHFQLVGSSASECDTIAGRQCMASCFFLLRHFDDVLIYLNSIKAYFFNDDTFNYNFGQTKAALGAWAEALEALTAVQDEKMRSEFTFISHLAKCYIMCNKARQAWELYLKMDTSSESFTLLQIIANDSYKTQQYLYAAKAFDVLERLDPSAPEHWEGKRGACLGVFQQVVQSREPREDLREVLSLLRNSSNPQVEYITRMIRRWLGTPGV
ncbi:tetratricopeptide repeat protein 26 [Catenaria anguillulae PL171]|uniref:Intraflagellar transport protein 56 n=1 Tax=Catenaria anguillulae PL171 TaxID=765915 RepID=A0A1Y2HSR4_9FUNG|nr:tetratricopeptide repeat protein 26 [Catenaria anguillulae PL171]